MEKECSLFVLLICCSTIRRYDVILSHALEWPSLSVQWLPGCTMFRLTVRFYE